MRFQRPGTPLGGTSFYGSREEQLARVFETLRGTWSRHLHVTIDLYKMTEDCDHVNPEEDERFEGVDDLIDEWMQRNCAGLNSSDWSLYYKNYQRAVVNIPLVLEYEKAMREWDDTHSNVCLASPMGTACGGCNEDTDADFGIKPGGCSLAEKAREEWDSFWELVSAG